MDTPAFWGFVGVIVGGAITGLTTLGVEWFKSRGESNLDKAKREDDRRLGLDTFQRETLLAVQNAIEEVNAVLVQMMSDTVDPTMPDRYRVATSRLLMLRSRVADDAVREATSNYIAAIGDLTRTRDADQRQEAFTRAGQNARTAIDRAGVLVRGTFRVDAA